MSAGQHAPAKDVDLTEVIVRAVEAAIAVVTGRLGLSSPGEVYARLQTGHEEAIAQFRSELVYEIGATLLWMDRQVKAVYVDPAAPKASLAAPLRIIVHAEQESGALRNLISAIQEILPEVEVQGQRPLAATRFEAIVLDDARLRITGRGYHAIHSSAPLISRNA